MTKFTLHIFCLIALAIASINVATAQDEIFVQITVAGPDKKPLKSARLVIGIETMGTTDVDGKLNILLPRDAEGTFNHPNCEPLVLKIRNRPVINVQMSEKNVSIETVVVKAPKVKSNVVLIEESDLEIKGNYLIIKPKFTIPLNLFSEADRFIFQPLLVNVTKKTERYFRPVVVDGRIMSANYERINEFKMSEDKISPYIIDMEVNRSNNVYAYKDSLYIDRTVMDDDMRSDCFMIITETFADPSDYRDTMVIGKGTKNPLRFLEYKFAPVPLVDSTLIPRPELKLVSEVGTSNVKFLVGKAAIDEKDPQNKVEFDQIDEKLQNVLKNPYATMRGIYVDGYSSPEGNFTTNQALAKKRTDLILGRMSASLTADQRKFVKLTSESHVEPWSKIATLASAEDPALAQKVSELTTKLKDRYSECQYAISRLPEYRSKIVTKYLPALRRVEYVLDYSIFRNLTDAEIREKALNGADDISRYEYWRLVESVTGDERDRFEEEAITKYSNFDLVANRVAIRMIEKDSLNLEILGTCVDEDTPNPILHNQAIVALGLKELNFADSLVTLLPDEKEYEYLRAIAAAMTGKYAEALPIIAPMGGLNEVLLLLCLNEDQEAFEKAKMLTEDPQYAQNAKVWYIYATCANRLDDLTWAQIALTNALTIDRSLLNIAKIDSELLDLVEIVEIMLPPVM
ncbi:MAG: hypothetical protein R3Y68_03905 [Rikenellaceae bacterium]